MGDNESGDYDIRAALESAASAQEGATETAAPATETPSEADTQAAQDRARDEHGRFAKKEEGDESGAKSGGEGSGGQAEGDAPEPKSDADADRDGGGKDKATSGGSDDAGDSLRETVAPPPGWSVASKSEWAKLPDHVKADIAKREAEVNDGFKQYAGMKEVLPYAQSYQQQGTSIKTVLEDYHRVANALQTQPIEAISEMCRRAGVDPARVGQALMGAQGGQQAQQHDPAQAALMQHLTPLQQQVEELKRTLSQREQAEVQAEHSRAQAEINSFASNPKHMYFENVKPLMSALLSSGQANTLEDAYEKAIWATPEIQQVLLRQREAEAATKAQQSRQNAVVNARSANKSITGAPTPGASSANGTKPQSTRALLEAAVQEQASGV